MMRLAIRLIIGMISFFSLLPVAHSTSKDTRPALESKR